MFSIVGILSPFDDSYYTIIWPICPELGPIFYSPLHRDEEEIDPTLPLDFLKARFEPMFTRVAWKSAIIFSNYIQNALTVDLIAAAEQLPQPYLTWLCKGGVTT